MPPHSTETQVIYVHIPYCSRKCSYCGFYSKVASGDRQAYVDALCKEIQMRAGDIWPHPHEVQTIYFGGGTPTLLSIAQLEQIVEQLHRSFNLSTMQEFTIEANPECLTKEYVDGLRTMGAFNRISIGVQSFADNDLRLLKRRHSGQEAREAIENVQERGYRNISVDLIYGIPGQTRDTWLQNLAVVAQSGIQHLSCYALTVEPGTILERQLQMGRTTLPDEETVIERYKTLLQWSGENGYTQYEVSNFCRGKYRSRHNSRYWNRTPYLGIGAAAHSFDGRLRRWNVADTSRYIEGVTTGKQYFESEQLNETNAVNEYIMTALRTTDGIDMQHVAEAYRTPLTQRMSKFVHNGLLTTTAVGFSPTTEGLLHADGMAAELFFTDDGRPLE